MFTPKRWRKRREWPEPVSAEAPLCEDFNDLVALFEELDNEIEIQEERAENRVDGLKAHRVNLYGKCI